MASEPAKDGVVSFGEFAANLRSRELRKHGAKVRLPDQSFQILAMLLERRGELITREEIRQRLWPADTFVDFDHGLNNAVNRLRETLGDSADEPRFVETLPRRGYRFVCPVEVTAAEPAVSVPPVSPSGVVPVKRGGLRRWAVVAAGSTILLLVILTVAALRTRMRVSASRITSVAVLPLENVSGDPAQDYFADGMTDEIITDLAGLRSVRVISRTSSMHYKGSHKSLPAIAQELRVDAVVEGTVARAGDRVRINAQLVDAANDQHLWAHQYEGDMNNVLQLQNDLASSIALEVVGKLTPNEASHFARKARQVNSQAYEAYLKGNYFLNKWTVVGFEKAKGYFEQSIALDPRYAEGYVGLADSYGTVAFMSTEPPREAWLKAEDTLAKALELDNTSSSAHALLGITKLQFRCDRPAAERELNHALELDPSNMRALDLHSYYLLESRHMDEAIAEKKTVLEHDPLSIRTNAELGLYLLHAGRIDEAIGQCRKTLELDPNYAAAHMRLGLAYAQKQQYDQAVNEMQKAISVDRKPRRLSRLGEVYARWGKRREALEMIRQIQEMSKQSYVTPAMSAIVYAQLNEKGPAVALLEKAKPEDDPKLSDPGFENLRSDPKFKTLEARLSPNRSCPAL
jgi:TolB-like protein/DNA-binding winged helix-turn-helix (wHTH) protein/Flp pilus assembly protein TadD